MEGQRFHGDDSASSNDAGMMGLGSCGLSHLAIGQASQAVRSWNDLQRSVACVVVIDVKPQAEERFKEGYWSFRVNPPSLDCPVLEPLGVHFLPQSDNPILMPGKMPVCLRCLIEGENANRPNISGRQLSGKTRQDPFWQQKGKHRRRGREWSRARTDRPSIEFFR